MWRLFDAVWKLDAITHLPQLADGPSAFWQVARASPSRTQLPAMHAPASFAVTHSHVNATRVNATGCTTTAREYHGQLTAGVYKNDGRYQLPVGVAGALDAHNMPPTATAAKRRTTTSSALPLFCIGHTVNEQV